MSVCGTCVGACVYFPGFLSVRITTCQYFDFDFTVFVCIPVRYSADLVKTISSTNADTYISNKSDTGKQLSRHRYLLTKKKLAGPRG